MRRLIPNSIDSIVTDPPYGITFMGKKWDVDCPSVDVWKECLRVLKPGGHLLSFSGTRMVDFIMGRIREAGFEVRDTITWLYGSGFPKSHNIGKKIPEWDGWGTALKPACEFIVMARKPFKGTVVDNVLKHGTGGLNIDDCRVETRTEDPNNRGNRGLGRSSGGFNKEYVNGQEGEPVKEYHQHQGRFPANLILDKEAGEMLDEQSGMSKSSSSIRNNGTSKNNCLSGDNLGHISKGHNDKGGASRFFYCAKASKAERNKGLEGLPEDTVLYNNTGLKNNGDGTKRPITQTQNHHPTVKPQKLMQYLCKLITPPGGTILDPFMGSGSTGVAAKSLEFKFIGIELNREYFKIAEKRCLKLNF